MKLSKEMSGLDIPNVNLKNSTLKLMIAKNTGSTKVQQFAVWAFGKPINCDFEIRDMVRLWNHRHGFEHEIDMEDLSMDSIDVMVNLWKENYQPVQRERSLSEGSRKVWFYGS